MNKTREIYISHLTEAKKFQEVLKDYPVGIETIEFSIATVLDTKEEGVAAYVQALMPEIKERPLAVHGPFFDLAPASFDSQIRCVTMARFEHAYNIARALGADRIIFHSGFIPITYYIEGWLGNSIRFWQEFMATKDQEIQVHIENVYEEAYWPIREVIDQVDHPSFSMCLDIGHVQAYSSLSLEEWIGAMGSRIRHVHLHDNDGSRDAHRGLTLGTIPIKETLRLLDEQAPKASYTLEVSDETELRTSLDFLFTL
ncbi:MAG: sugar phosphate isomerase/epimerase family protein [Cellulosilyticaceae bacterium]